MCDTSTRIAQFTGRGFVTAPAGHGKTHSICEAVSQAEGRQLILTHTYAGVSALVKQLKALGVSSDKYNVNTIAGWALKLCLSYPRSSGFSNTEPRSNEEWLRLYEAATGFIQLDFVERIIRASYAGLLVDEYQDCQSQQHALILALSLRLPTRILGDPLQGIFEFQGQELVDWSVDVEAQFDCIGELCTPHRWTQIGNSDLASWLTTIRRDLVRGTPVVLENVPPCVDIVKTTSEKLLRTQQNACRYFNLPQDDTVVAIHTGLMINACHSLAKNVSGKFHSIEQVEGTAVFDFISAFEAKTANSDKLECLLVLLRKSMSSVNASLTAAARRGDVTRLQVNTPNRDLAVAVNSFLEEASSANLNSIIVEMRLLNDVKVSRRDLVNRLQAILKKHSSSDSSLTDCAHEYHREFRHYGRPVRHPKMVSTTLLVKGQQFDHAIVLDAAALSRRELYVALTRGSKTLKIITTDTTLNPSD